MGTLIVGIAVLGILSAASYSIFKDKKAGKNPVCGCVGGNCANCSGRGSNL